MTKRQQDKKTTRQKDKMTKRQKTKTKRRFNFFDVRAVSHSCDVLGLCHPKLWVGVGQKA